MALEFNPEEDLAFSGECPSGFVIEPFFLSLDGKSILKVTNHSQQKIIFHLQASGRSQYSIIPPCAFLDSTNSIQIRSKSLN